MRFSSTIKAGQSQYNRDVKPNKKCYSLVFILKTNYNIKHKHITCLEKKVQFPSIYVHIIYVTKLAEICNFCTLVSIYFFKGLHNNQCLLKQAFFNCDIASQPMHLLYTYYKYCRFNPFIIGPADFTTNKVCSRIKSSVFKSVWIHTRNAVTLIC